MGVWKLSLGSCLESPGPSNKASTPPNANNVETLKTPNIPEPPNWGEVHVSMDGRGVVAEARQVPLQRGYSQDRVFKRDLEPRCRPCASNQAAVRFMATKIRVESVGLVLRTWVVVGPRRTQTSTTFNRSPFLCLRWAPDLGQDVRLACAGGYRNASMASTNMSSASCSALSSTLNPAACLGCR